MKLEIGSKIKLIPYSNIEKRVVNGDIDDIIRITIQHGMLKWFGKEVEIKEINKNFSNRFQIKGCIWWFDKSFIDSNINKSFNILKQI